MNRYRNRILVVASLSIGLLLTAPARAGTYSKVNQSDWQAGVTGLPSYVNMYDYVPSTVASKPPIVVYCHHCQGTASSSHSSNVTLESIAEKNGFIIIYPEATGENCWDAGSKRSLKHGGGGDTGAIVQMVKYTLSKYSGDAGRVYVAGDSAGGIMTEALLGVYPDVFMAGVSIMGVPCGCWGQSDYNDTTGTGSTAQWCGSCAGGTVSMTGQQWGDLVRSYFPGYTGHRPRLQHWHGASDTTLNYKNMAEDIKEWTNLLDLSETPTGTEANTPKSGTTHQFWKNSCYTVYETFSLAGVGHAVSFDGNAGAAYFGLDKAGGQDPEAAACPGTGGSGGAGGAGGATGAGGTGAARDAGPDGRDGASDVGGTGSGGVQGNGGSGSVGIGGRSGTGGTGGTGGSVGSGGITANGGSSGGNAGDVGTGGGAGRGGTTAKGGTGGGGGAVGTGGSEGSGGSSVKGGSGGDGGGAAQGGGGASGQGGSATGGATTRGDASTGGCGCALGSHAGDSTARVATLLLAALVLVLHRRKRQARGVPKLIATTHAASR
jgi:poly(hydroxyalkanoate) depolymerase family esterase